MSDGLLVSCFFCGERQGVCFKWPNHICSCAFATLLPPQFLKVSQLLSKLSLNVQSLLIVVVESEKSKPRGVFEYPG